LPVAYSGVISGTRRREILAEAVLGMTVFMPSPAHKAIDTAVTRD
jgi:hypothetical protein